MMGLGKNRSLFGEWLDSTKYSQIEFAQISGVTRETISKVANDNNYIPSSIVMKKIMSAVKKIDPIRRSSDFWDI